MKKSISIILFVILILNFFSCSKDVSREPVIVKTAFVMNTVCTIRVYDKGADIKTVDDAIIYIKSLENLLSRHISTSDISKINNCAGEKWVKTDEQTINLIKKCINYSYLTDGAFDITIGALVDLWDINSEEHYIPSKDKIKLALNKTGYKNILIDENNCSVKLAKKGILMDLGAAGKGYISQMTKLYLEERGVKSAVVDFGGNIVLLGKNNDKENFKIGIQTPFKERGQYNAVIDSEKSAIVSSGNYEQFFKSSDGRIYHHILNPKTGEPVQNGLYQITVICDDATDADILSTSIYVMGKEKGIELLNKINDGSGAVFTDDKYKITMTQNIKNNVNILK